MTWYTWHGEELILTLHLQPRASKDEFVGPHGDAYKVRITAPPVDGKANAHLVKFLAKAFGVPKNNVEILTGESSREKRVKIKSPNKFPVDCKPRV